MNLIAHGTFQRRPALRRNTGPRRAGFSLLEMLVVLMIVGLLAGLIVPAVSQGSTRDRERAEMAELARMLATERVEAVRTMQPRAVRLRFAPQEGWTVTRFDETDKPASMAWGSGLLEPGDPETGGPAPDRDADQDSTWEIRFAPSGRTHTLSLDFVAAGGSDRIWRLEFDPVSGSPSVELGREAES